MENLNAETVKKALECCIKAECWGDCQELGCPASTKHGCHFYLRTDDDNENALYIEMLKDALALINSQEQRIGELEAECEQWRSDWEENQKQWEIAYDKLESENARLTEEVAEEKAKGEMCAEVIKRQDKEIAKKDAEIKRLRESYEIVAKLWAKDRAAKTIQKGE